MLLGACTPVRTVYDKYGEEVKESDGATQSDLNSRFEKEFESAFMEKKGKDGVPQTSSNRVSSFQKQLDESRKIQDEYHTKSYGAIRENDSRSVIYSGAGADSRYSRDSDRREKERAEPDRRERRSNRFAKRRVVLRSVKARNKNADAERQTADQADEQRNERNVRADRRQRFVADVPPDDDQIRHIERDLKDVR